MNILVFKTNLADAGRVQDAATTLNMHPYIEQWNVDLHDHDNVLRIISNRIAVIEVEKLLTNAGYYCEELQ